MTNNTHQHIQQKTNKKNIRYLDISNHDLNGTADLKEFSTLTSLNAYNNKLESIEFLDTLPNKEKLVSINFFGNQIKELDLAHLISTFPNLQKINCGNNPLKAKNLDNLTSEQFGKLVEGMKEGKIQINSYKGTILMDLLAYSQKLVANGNNNQQQNAHYLQNLISGNSGKEFEKQPDKNNTPLLVGGLVIFGVLAVGIGYFWGKKGERKSYED